jgi:quercetin dioxygenase-like cupin family protein
MRYPAGKPSDAHSHPNEQWIFILEGTFHARVGDQDVVAPPGTVLYVPSGVEHRGKAGPEADVVFFTVKDTSHGLHGVKAA